MLGWFLENTLAVGGLTLVVYLLCRLVRFRPAVEHALWLLILVKLLTPAWLAWPRLAVNLASRPAAEIAPPEGAAITAVTSSVASPVTVNQRHFTANQPQAVAVAENIAAPTRRPAPSHGIPNVAIRQEPERRSASATSRWYLRGDVVAECLLRLWAAGAVLLAGWQVFQTLRFRRRVRGGQPAPEPLSQQWGELAIRMGVRPPAVKTLSGLASPILWCLGRPKLLWPTGLEETLDASATRSLLVHELAHLRRRDHWVAWLELAAMLFWWWNPLFWYVRRRLRQSAEMACDAWVVWALPDARRTYAESLVTVREWASGGRVVAPAWGALGEVRNLERRLTMIFRDNVPRRLSWGSLLMILLLAALVLPGWSRGEEKKPKNATTAVVERGMPGDMPAASAPATKPETVATNLVQSWTEPSGTTETVVTPDGRRRARVPAPSSPTGASPALAIELQGGDLVRVPSDATIRVFPLKHRTPEEMISILEGVWGLTPEDLIVVRPVRHAREAAKSGGVYGPATTAAPAGGTGMAGYSIPYATPGGLPPGPMTTANGTALPIRLAADPRTKSLIARGSAEHIERVAKIVAAADASEKVPDQQTEKLGNLRAITLKHRNVAELAKILQSLGITVAELGLPTEPADKATNDTAPIDKLLMIAGPDKDVAELQKLIESLDVEGSEPKGEPTPAPLMPTPMPENSPLPLPPQ